MLNSNTLVDTFTALMDDIFWTGYAQTLAEENPDYFTQLLNDYLLAHTGTTIN
jgi:hypothetical protein